ncbi:35129_t:CDS:1, partial [Racocetra persica]
HKVDSKVNTAEIITKKDDLYILIERNHKETEEAERETERILNSN